MPKVTPKVELLAYTPNPEQTIAVAAKLCYSNSDIEALTKGLENKDISKFIEKLLSLGHLSPIEHASFTFGIEGVSRSLLAQITRHRIASFSVKSQRYVSANNGEVFNYIIPPAIKELGAEYESKFENQMAQMQEWYNEWQTLLGGAGEKSNEDARFVLPNASETKMILTMNARELMHYFELRCCNRAQWEIRAISWEMLRLVREVAPNLFKHCGPACVNGACSEGKMSCKKMSEVKEFHEKMMEKGSLL
ncbi:MAG: FAD-dependent thymidylate synthase [Clostridia bacterium]|nr:FAD-dependent thymidylate synthase [Clostridia bacterium]